MLEARKEIIDNFGKQKEVEEVLKVFVDKSETFFDVDNVRWNNVDIFFKTKENTDTWNISKFKKRIFSKCKFWDNFRTLDNLNTREDIEKTKHERLQSKFQMLSRGYQF